MTPDEKDPHPEEYGVEEGVTGRELLARAAGEIPYESAFPKGFAPGTGPGGPVEGAKTFDHPLERNVHVGGLWVSSCICPQCGERFAHVGMMGRPEQEPDPPCWRCEVAVGVPLDPEEAAAMAEFRWRYDAFLEAIDVGGGKIGKSREDMRHTFVVVCDSGIKYAPVLLKALERRYGDQVVRATQAIATGAVQGVELVDVQLRVKPAGTHRGPLFHDEEPDPK